MLYPTTGSDESGGQVQLRSTSCDSPTPLSPTVGDEALLEMASWPVNDPAVAGSNCTSSVSDCPGLSVAGSEAPDTEKSVPLTAAELTVREAVPVELNVIGCATGVPSLTFPNPIDVAFRDKTAVAAFSCSETVWEMLPAVAVRVADCALLTAAALAVNAAPVAVAGTVTEAGTVTALLLLARLTMRPPVGAEPDKLTVQASVSDPVIEVLLQETALTVGVTAVLVPLRLTVAVGAVLEIVNCPVTEPAPVGLNWTVSTSACPGFNVAGKLPPETANPVPVIASELTVTAAVPEEVRVTDCVPVEPTATLPNESVVALMVSAGEPVAGEIVMSKYSVTPPAWAVMVAFWVIATLATAALNAALIAPGFTVNPLGTVTYGSLLDSVTLTAALAAAVRFTEQTSVAVEP